ncbi:MAG: class I SAM-dependent methyltransferase [Ignavibacteriaceae bacterium]
MREYIENIAATYRGSKKRSIPIIIGQKELLKKSCEAHIFNKSFYNQLVIESNDFYIAYYNKPGWWFKFRYDTQYKVKSALFALRKVKFNDARKNIFEFGFGSGELLLRFHRASGIYGIEISPIAIDKMKNKMSKGKKIVNDFKLANKNDIYSFQKYGFDLIIASHVIEHLENTDEFIAQICYLMKDNGIVLIQIPINEEFKDPKHVKEFSTASLINYFEKKGFRCLISFENEFVFHFVEALYRRNIEGSWSFTDNFKRILFNFVFALLPYKVCQIIDEIISSKKQLKPRQSVAIFQRK